MTTVSDLQEQTSKMAQRGMDAVHDTALQLREQAQLSTDATVQYIQREPIKSVLIAAAAGATLMAVVSLLNRNR
jgi:ElaB/YqjD/DUF883 family membrane-anchored ribosome-binding protein